MHDNWVAVPVAATAAFLIGALWYSPVLFATSWVRAHGFPPEKVAALRANAARAYAGSFVAFLLMAFVLQLVIHHTGQDSAGGGAGWGFHAWVGFALPLGIIAYLYSGTPRTVLFIDLGYQFVYLIVMGAILGAWQ